MLNWFIESGGFQFAMLVAVVLAVGIGIAATVRRERAAARLARKSVEAHLPAARAVEPTAPVASRPALALLEFDDDPGVVPIEARAVTIGRHSEDTVCVKDVTVSRHHALLVMKDDGRFEIVNQTTTRPEPNPILVNGVYREQADLSDGDLVTLGGVTFRFRAGQTAA